MSTVADTFTLAFQTHQAGNLARAEQLYRQVLDGDPNHADTHHLLGVLACQMGHHATAIASIRRALLLNPWAAVYHNNLGLAHKTLGHMHEAAASFQQAILLQPNDAKIHYNLADVLLVLGKHAEAMRHWQQAVHFQPNFPEAHHSLGNAFLRLGQREQAAVHYQEALRLNPNNAEAHSNFGIALAGDGKLDEAMSHWQEALRLNPNRAEAHHNIGTALRSQGKWDEAVLCFEKALQLRPDYAEPHYNLGNLAQDQGKLDKAMWHYRQALRFNPENGNAHYNMASVLQKQERYNDALAHCNEALRLRPDFPEAHLSRALLWLQLGDYEQGWPEYEWRWLCPGAVPRNFSQPLWDGSPLNGQRILLHAEQGLGDTLHFIRYAPLVKQRGGTVLVECQRALMQVLASVPGIDALIPQGSPLPTFDVQAAMLTLPGILQTRLDTMPANIPYLHADAALVAHWRKELEPLRGFKIGIIWQGGATNPSRQRDIPLAEFAALARLEGVQLISLQKGPGTAELRELSARVPVVDFNEHLDKAAGPFMDTAAIMTNIDLVISSDTSVPHLAGGLGVPVWVALPLNADWRWLLRRADCPWYPTMRLFRQTQLGGWQEVFERMAEEVKGMMARYLS